MLAGENAKRGEERSSSPGRLVFFASSLGADAAPPMQMAARTAAVLYDTGHLLSAWGLAALDQTSRPADNERTMSLRLEPSAAVREKRLKQLLGERGVDRGDAGLARIVEDAMLVGS